MRLDLVKQSDVQNPQERTECQVRALNAATTN